MIRKPNYKNLFENRVFLLLIFTVLIFIGLTVRLFFLQIVHGEEHLADIRTTTLRTMPIEAQRGNIYDRFGVPLAVNQAAYSVKYDLSVPCEDLNKMLQSLFQKLDYAGEELIDEFPVTKEKPYSFTFRSESEEKRWKNDMGFKEEQMKFSAEETVQYLKTYFEISNDYSEIDIRRLLSTRSEIYLQRFRKYNAVTIAKDVGDKTIAVIEESKEEFPGVYIDVDSLRLYTAGESMSHILGYVGKINDKELLELEEEGYGSSDTVGKLGIEKAYELVLNGKKGEEIIEVDISGKRVSKTETTAPQNGGNVFLTIDSRLQQKTNEALKENLKIVLLQEIDSGKYSIKHVFQSMIDSNALSIRKIMDAQQGQHQFQLKQMILDNNEKFSLKDTQHMEDAKQLLSEGIASGDISQWDMLYCLKEQERIDFEEGDKRSAYQVLRENIVNDKLRINELNLDPCTGSVAVVDVNTGETLALVTYPNYDNNRLVNVFDNDYYQMLLDDPTTPLINRPTMERKAPGSTFKMLSAVAGLESGTVTKNTLIQDKGIYKEVGLPYAKCLIYSSYGSTHGMVDVEKALEVSCNYYFYELAYRMGNAKEGTTLDSIGIMNDYMKKFGLGDYSGIEIEESKPKMATPEAKAAAVSAYAENASESQKRWMDGDSIRSAIGQSYNSYSTINLAKYVATLANGGTRYKLTLEKSIEDASQSEISYATPEVEENLALSESTIKAVHRGMLRVTNGERGSLRNYFKDFPLEVAAKTGTAEEAKNRPSHSWFVGFAPYDSPQIAVVVQLPFGETTTGPATKIAKEVISEYFGLEKETEKSTAYQNILTR